MAVSFCGKRLLLTRSNLLANQKRHGYIVLVPEIGEDLPERNPLARSESGLPEFNNVTIEKCIGTIGQQAAGVERSVKAIEEKIAAVAASGDQLDVKKDIFLPLEMVGVPLETTWGVAKTLYLGNSSKMPTKSYMTIHKRARAARTSKFSSLPIYNALKGVETGGDKQKFTMEEKRLINKYLLESKLSGIDVDESSKAQLIAIMQKLAQERSKFHGKQEVAVKKFSHVIKDPALMQEFPPSLLQALAVDQSQVVKGPWKITLQPFVVQNFLEYCPDRTQRWNVWQADTRKCSTYTDKELENSNHLEEIRSLRKRHAKLIGFESFAHMSMQTKMVGSVEQLQGTLDELHQYARPALDSEMESLGQFAGDNGYKGVLDVYDVPYWKRRQLSELHQYDKEALREYFAMPKVLSGLFLLAEALFGIKIVERTGLDTWHEDVRFYDIFDSNKGSEPIAGFYMDLYSRDDEKISVTGNSGWMVGIVNKSIAAGEKPLAALICNFPAPLYGKPSLLTLDDVQILFHKFGHALQHMLTETHYSDVAGLSNVEWDAVEVSGFVLTCLLQDPDVLRSISSHYGTGETLPDAFIQAIQKRHTHLAGYELCRELYFANLDLELHLRSDYWLDIVKQLYPQFHSFPLDSKDAHPCSMTTIFSGDWGAAYYSRLWSRMLAADVYSAFVKAKGKGQQAEVGRRFRDTFLALGGACHPSEVFRQFRGRDPSPIALLQALGIYKNVHGTAPGTSTAKPKEEQ
ncbi:uncharacterized protein LOC131692984 [Topomyia yanbarensis]|uniref:uncharacterized protein LOC131692984 n=1 Tax=Topomyia yanbarensis TaxID=2498891 RepID=UPI00273AC943|nr:uncharacterized protein LOC131692984 [Topomyia yanbarensis]